MIHQCTKDVNYFITHVNHSKLYLETLSPCKDQICPQSLKQNSFLMVIVSKYSEIGNCVSSLNTSFAFW